MKNPCGMAGPVRTGDALLMPGLGAVITRVVVVSLLLFLPTATARELQKLVLTFFGTPTCGECIEIKEEVLYPLGRAHPDAIELRIYDIDTREGIELLLQMEEQYGVTRSSAIALFLPDTFLTSSGDILEQGTDLVQRRLAHPALWRNVGADEKDTLSSSVPRSGSPWYPWLWGGVAAGSMVVLAVYGRGRGVPRPR